MLDGEYVAVAGRRDPRRRWAALRYRYDPSRERRSRIVTDGKDDELAATGRPFLGGQALSWDDQPL
jgi:hypothetical protein